MNPRWYIFHKGEQLGNVWAPDAARALALANLVRDQRPLTVISEAAWATYSREGRRVFAEPETIEHLTCEVRVRPDGKRVATCLKCHRDVVQPAARGHGTRVGRPQRYHDECLPPSNRRWKRAVQQQAARA